MLMFRIIKDEQWSPVKERLERDADRKVKGEERLDLKEELRHSCTAGKWNNLPDDLRHMESIKKFKTRLRGRD